MKKAFAVLLALLLFCISSLAAAETLIVTPGQQSNCVPEMFKMYFSLISTSAGLNFIWDDDVTNDGTYDIYKATSEDGMMVISVYAKDGSVVYTESIGTLTVKADDSDAAERFGSWFGAALSGAALGFYINDNGLDSLGETNLYNRFTNDLIPYLTALTSMGAKGDAALAEGFVCISPVLGYPAGLEIKGTAADDTISLSLRVIVMTPGGQLEK